MVKKFLLIFAILFAPCMVHADNIILNSSEVLEEEILPLNVDLLYRLYSSDVLSHNCTEEEDLLNYFIEGKIKIPFSAKQLLKKCVDATECKDKKMRKAGCNRFILNYMRANAENSMPTNESNNGELVGEEMQFEPQIAHERKNEKRLSNDDIGIRELEPQYARAVSCTETIYDENGNKIGERDCMDKTQQPGRPTPEAFREQNVPSSQPQ